MPVRAVRRAVAAAIVVAAVPCSGRAAEAPGVAEAAGPGVAGHLGAEAVRALVQAAPAGGVDLAGRDMAGDDLTDLDLSGARLAGARLGGATLHGVRLVGADLTGADLHGADLTFAWFIRARFDHADLRGAVLQTVVTSKGMDNTAEQAASFVGADLSGSSTTVHFSFDDLHGASFAHARMSAVIANQSMGLLRTEFMSCNLEGADFEGAGLGHNLFRFARLRGANFRGADLTAADFTGAYLEGADFSGATLTAATFKGASVAGAKGLEEVGR